MSSYYFNLLSEKCWQSPGKHMTQQFACMCGRAYVFELFDMHALLSMIGADFVPQMKCY